ncbi:capsule polysaccharide biosynthesis protein [Colletotrichum truncatum]|uniref:Capsule polysaccharide biosynthesis protein n=1 Tax=Colletotrichum truncatum TaxID=5467 RepID=A0ACC3YK76_COLTU|nr:capsule polysaccharide biosynthesis protein [Colletotrichum truncatum]KAF6784377.1 capsule polysaccharide biosynthesis protein [Colletotrichum truncatum]
MATSHFEIPSEFQDKIRYVEPLDLRSDEEILEALTRPPPVASEKNIWAFWHAGIRDMPPWCQRNIIAWSRICGPQWTIRVLDVVDNSPNNALNWVKEEDLPKAFTTKTMDGPLGYTGPHSADFLRGICLYQYGGAWMDVGSILFRSIDEICWRKLEDANEPYQVAGPWMYQRGIANHFIASRKGDPFIKHWHDLFMELWKDRTSANGLYEHPLMAHAKDIKLEDVEARGFSWSWDTPIPIVLEYIAQICCWIRLSILKEPNDGFDGANYYEKKILLFDALWEDWPAEALIGWNGEELFDLLNTRLDADSESEAYKKAYKTVWYLLASSTMQKVTRAGGLTTTKALGALWDMKENEEKDREPGTFAELLRYGSVHFRQTREAPYVPPMEAQGIIHKGVLEP